MQFTILTILNCTGQVLTVDTLLCAGSLELFHIAKETLITH